MGSMEEHLSNIVSKRGRDLWKSPRGTVLRIEALALVAIVISFFLAFFGSCRCWSNRWILQKGILAAQVLSLSLGTYSIGLMQSSPVKSSMYPIWAVSLLTLFGCVDPITTYMGLDYKGPMSKMIFQLCLYFGYVMLMSVSTISNDVAKLAIVLLSTITFMKGFHRALAFVLPGQICEDKKRSLDAVEPAAFAYNDDRMIVHVTQFTEYVTMADIQGLGLPEGTTANGLAIKDVCLSYSFARLLRKHFLGLDTSREMEEKIRAFEMVVHKIDYKRALKVVEVELAFLFEAFFTSNEFLHLYQAKIYSFWALASFVGICFVGVVSAVIPGAMGSHRNIINSAAATTGCLGGGTSVVVGTTTADLIITVVILVSLALLQLVQLMWCLTSNWARVRIACDEAKKKRSSCNNQIMSRRWVMGLRLFLVDRVNYFDKYLWQARLGQDSLHKHIKRRVARDFDKFLLEKVGVQYFCGLVKAVLLSDATNPGGAVDLNDDVKASIAEFLGTIKSRRIGVEWSALFLENGLQDWLEYLPYTNTRVPVGLRHDESEAYAFTCGVMIWHIATCYCEEADKGPGSSSREKNRRVAIHLSKYCTYLVVSAPELLPGPASVTKAALGHTVDWTRTKSALSGYSFLLPVTQQVPMQLGFVVKAGECLGKWLCNEEMKKPPTPLDLADPLGRRWKEGEESTGRPACTSDQCWELLARVWVQTLLYAAPYGDVQAHMQRLAQGGEFITHLWALLFHLGIDRWQVAGIDELKGGAAAKPETTMTEAHVQEDAVSSRVAKLNRSKSMP